MSKKYQKKLGINVYEAAKQRIHHIFDLYDTVAVLFSGGKDSLTCVHLTKEVMTERGLLQKGEKVRTIFQDEELMPDTVIDFVNEYRQKDWMDMRWVCNPIEGRMCYRGNSKEFTMWGPNRTKFVREIPPWAVVPKWEKAYVKNGMDDILTEGYKGRVCLITGMRCTESIYRRTMFMQKCVDNYILRSTTAPHVHKASPLFDWLENDIFYFFYLNKIRYCPIYDQQMYSRESLRVASPLISERIGFLPKLKASDPDYFQRIIDAFPEVALQERYGEDFTIKKSIPKIKTWREAAEYLRETVKDTKAVKVMLDRLRKCKSRGVHGPDIEVAVRKAIETTGTKPIHLQPDGWHDPKMNGPKREWKHGRR